MPASQLGYAVHVAEGIPTSTTDVPPDLDKRMWSPTSATLITGDYVAVLVDPLFTRSQAEALVDWVTASGKNLTAVYITHGHPDHWLGLGTILAAFPAAQAFAVPSVVAQMRAHSTPEVLAGQWQSRFTEPLAAPVAIADPVPPAGLHLEGHELIPVELGHTDTDDTTVLHVPSIGLVVAGDVVYNGVHQYLLESAHGGIKAWLQALSTVAALHPRTVVAGHKNKDRADDPKTINETRDYLLDAQRLLAGTPSPDDFFNHMIRLYPDRLNVGPVWYSALALLS